MKLFPRYIILFVLLFIVSGNEDIKNEQGTEFDNKELTSPPNIIIILADDLGYNDVGFNGSTDILTPNIDKIAEGGVKFTNGYVSYAVCGPSRAGLITGRYQDRFGFSRNPLLAPNDVEMGLPLSEETLAEALQQANYKSVAIGKWHLGAEERLVPTQRGFDDFFGFLSGGHQYFPETWTIQDVYEAKEQFDGYRTKMLRNQTPVEENQYLTDALSREAVSHLEKYKEEPFFLYLAYNAPHTPLQASDKYLNRYKHIKDPKRRTYAAMVSAMDDGVGLVLNKLEELNLTDNTIIFFLSDNGGPEEANGSNNGNLRGGKSDLFEGGVHVPFALKWPSKLKGGQVYTNPVISLDIFATVIAQIPGMKTKNEIDGVNLLPFLTDITDKVPHQFLYWRKYDNQEFAIRQGSGHKLIARKNLNLLFDLQKDQGERVNILKNEENIYGELKGAYQEWESQTIAPAFLGLLQDKEYQELHIDRFKRK